MAFAVLRPFWHFSLLVIAALISSSNGKDVGECSCGYYDHTTQELYTNSAIVYFNETTELPAEVFVPEVYENQYEKGWNSRFRQAATASNVAIAKDQYASNTSLHLSVDPSTPNHLVVGGAVHTSRRDLLYGSFTTLMRSPRSWIPGSALSMTLHYNDSQTINFDVMNPSEATAWVAMLSHEEFPDRTLGVNYSVLSNSTNDISPWDYTEFRLDWTEQELKYSIGGKPFRTISKKSSKNFPETPTLLRLKHWSVGNWFTMQGPPTNYSVANVGWVRMFFNSSTMTVQDRDAFTRRCSLESACATADMSLRGSSPYSEESIVNWSQAPNPRSSRLIPKIILIISGSLSTFLLANALLRRIPRRSQNSHRQMKSAEEKAPATRYESPFGATSEVAIALPSVPASANESSSTSYHGSRATSKHGSRAASCFGGEDTPNKAMSSSRNSLGPYLHIQMGATTPSESGKDEPKRPRLSWREFSQRMEKLQQDEAESPCIHLEDDVSIYNEAERPAEGPYIHLEDRASANNEGGSEVSSMSGDSYVARSQSYRDFVPANPAWPAAEVVEIQTPVESKAHSRRNSMTKAHPSAVRDFEVPAPSKSTGDCTIEMYPAASKLPSDKTRIDYLAGLLCFSCLLVTVIQFALTFSPASVDPGADTHYKTESWVRKTISAYFLNLVWVGPFLLTSARFLVSGYLEHGELLDIAHKVVSRPFRLLLPILAIAMLEYFFMDSGATNWLEYLPSITWSTWPFTTVPNNFGYFLSEILELAYLIPNAAPNITFNYCTGVLWTIPVQLQNSWVALLGVLVVTQIKTPWKRFGYYCFCMIQNWYALSWGTYFWFGIMLTDMEINYNYRKWLYARPMAYYPLIALCACMTFGGLSVDMVTQLTRVNYASYEYGIHPDIPTGIPIMYTGAVGYPQYYVPKLNGIVFAFGLQTLVELSPLVQSLFSFKVLLCVFPHIYTVYLIHGFIFWSLGPTVFVYLSAQGFAYWAMVTVVAVCCYAALFFSVFLLTPIVNTLGSGDNIWVFAHETPSPRRPTLYPFPNNFLFVRQEYAQDILAEAEPGEMPAVVTKDRSRFKKLVLGLAAVVMPKLNNQPCQPEVVSRSRSNSAAGTAVPARSVGWRTGGLSKSVVMLRRNNSNASRKRV